MIIANIDHQEVSSRNVSQHTEGQQIQMQMSQEDGNQQIEARNDTNFSHSEYNLQSLRNNFFENYDNKVIKRQFCEDTIWTIYLISCQILCP